VTEGCGLVAEEPEPDGGAVVVVVVVVVVGTWIGADVDWPTAFDIACVGARVVVGIGSPAEMAKYDPNALLCPTISVPLNEKSRRGSK
jgi:hypothetical protein